MGEIAVAIADDNERILDLLGEMIENNKEMKLVGKANNGEDVYTLIKENSQMCTIRSDYAENGRIKCYGYRESGS